MCVPCIVRTQEQIAHRTPSFLRPAHDPESFYHDEDLRLLNFTNVLCANGSNSLVSGCCQLMCKASEHSSTASTTTSKPMWTKHFSVLLNVSSPLTIWYRFSSVVVSLPEHLGNCAEKIERRHIWTRMLSKARVISLTLRFYGREIWRWSSYSNVTKNQKNARWRGNFCWISGRYKIEGL